MEQTTNSTNTAAAPKRQESIRFILESLEEMGPEKQSIFLEAIRGINQRMTQ